MATKEISFQIISATISNELCDKYYLQSGDSLMQYRFQPRVVIQNTRLPGFCENVLGDGNCLYRSVCLAIAGSDQSYMQLKQQTAFELHINRSNLVHIPEANIDSLIKSAKRQGVYGEVRHLIALSVALKIKIYLFNRSRRPPQWETIIAVLKPECHPIQVLMA